MIACVRQARWQSQQVMAGGRGREGGCKEVGHVAVVVSA